VAIPRDPDEHRLDRWVAEVRAEDERSAREREAGLLRQQAEGSTFVGLLIGLCESDDEVVVTTTAGRHSGRVHTVGLDFVIIAVLARRVVVPYRHVLTVRGGPEGSPPIATEATLPLDSTLGETLTALVEEQNMVAITLTSGEHLGGELQTVGQDFLTLGLEGERRRSVAISFAALAELSLS
jgi:hypothetical protein